MVAKKKMLTVKVAYPVWFNDRLYQPGETATVPEALALEWIEQVRAAYVTAEDKTDDEG